MKQSSNRMVFYTILNIRVVSLITLFIPTERFHPLQIEQNFTQNLRKMLKHIVFQVESTSLTLNENVFQFGKLEHSERLREGLGIFGLHEM